MSPAHLKVADLDHLHQNAHTGSQVLVILAAIADVVPALIREWIRWILQLGFMTARTLDAR